MNSFCRYFQSPIGLLKLSSDYYRLKSVCFVENNEKDENLPVPEILNKAAAQLKEYFDGTRFNFDLALDPEGTPFQKNVWALIEKVSYGKTANYGEIAGELGSIKYCRSVGMANGKNPIPIIIPCHRIIGMNGKLVGYAGGIERKKWLLLHEQKYSGNFLLF